MNMKNEENLFLKKSWKKSLDYDFFDWVRQTAAEILPGAYSVRVRASYRDVVGESSASFVVHKTLIGASAPRYEESTRNLLVVLIAGISFFFLFSAYQFWKIRRYIH